MLRPWGKNCHPKERLGNQLLRAAVVLAQELDKLEVGWAWEQPSQSFLWQVQDLISPLHSGPFYQTTFDWCRYGRKWRKRTTVIGRFPFLAEFNALCRGGHEHLVLDGGLWDQTESE
ncbi:unnamed protein product [Polarella glacialis]|uniref:Uncharacterized protein n=1 Tax=Polarella glacialis TaxID=89957 RepID=A0A813DMA0_POLGL|nr:unnamed protein product [Polarella glacialis]